MQEFAIIVAGGSGTRMESIVPKQFLPVNGLPVLMHTIKAFRRYSEALNIVLVLPSPHFAYWEELCASYEFREKLTLIAGGETRFHSVKNGLDSISADANALIAVHDAVRPVIDPVIIDKSFRQADEHGTAVTSVPLKDSIREIKDNHNIALDRSAFRLIQTPQTFRVEWMRNAFGAPYQNTFTDCASVLEAAGYPIHLIEGSYENIKVTTPEDLKWASIYLEQ